MTPADILAAFTTLPPLYSRWTHHGGLRVLVVGHAWDAERDVPLIEYRHIVPGSETDASCATEYINFAHTLADWMLGRFVGE